MIWKLRKFKKYVKLDLFIKRTEFKQTFNEQNINDLDPSIWGRWSVMISTGDLNLSQKNKRKKQNPNGKKTHILLNNCTRSFFGPSTRSFVDCSSLKFTLEGVGVGPTQSHWQNIKSKKFRHSPISLNKVSLWSL